MNDKVRSWCRNIIMAKWARVLALAATALVGALLTVYFLGSMGMSMQGVTFRVSALPALHGATILDLSPFGQVWAKTHRAPLQLRVKFEEISVDSIKTDWTDKSARDKTLSTMRKRVPGVVGQFALREVAVGFAGGFLLVLLLWRSRLRTALVSGFGGAALVALVLVSAGLSYNVNAFREPHFEGPISMAPAAIKMVGNSLDNIDQIKDRTGQVVSNIKNLFANIDSLAVLGNPIKEKETRAILLVSDLHSNMIGVQFMKTLAEHFKVDFIIDAGDITDLGSPLEAGMIEGLRNLDVPHVFVPGNHDTPQIARFLSGIKSTYVLNGGTITLDGLRIYGSPDPLFQLGKVEAKDEEEWDRILNIQTKALRTALQKQGRPDILVVHNQWVADGLIDEAPLIVTGHTHSLDLEQSDHGVLINPGTTGAAGLRGFYSQTDLPYSAVIVYVRPKIGPVAADIIKYDPRSARFSLDRQLLNPDVKI